jgi:phosphoribosylformylglycinamidine synthase subunit PurS
VNFKARVVIMPRAGISDPQGGLVKRGLFGLGFAEVAAARMGKYLELTLDSASEESARERVSLMCRQLLASRAIEDFSFDLLSSADPPEPERETSPAAPEPEA